MYEKKILPSREAWLEERKRYIGGSDAACIIGKNPWKTNGDLWDEKAGRKQAEDISQKPAVLYGTLAESPLRELFKLDHPEFEVWYEPNNLFTNPDYPFAEASMDGMLKEKDTGRIGCWECKTTNIVNPTGWKKWEGKLPENYYCQVLHQMAVTEARFAILSVQFQYLDKKGNGTVWHRREYRIERSREVEDDIRFLMDHERDFAESLKSGKKPATILPSI